MSSQSENVVALGKKIVTELGIDKSCDTLGRWMSHRIAELIRAAETCPENERAEREAACADAVLQIWSHRNSLANGHRPFGDFEQIFRTLQLLDPEESSQAYYRRQRVSASEDQGDSEVGKWLEIADSLDLIARVLIRHCLVSAAAAVDDDSKEWVQMTKAFVTDADKDVLIVKILSEVVEEEEPESPDEIRFRRKVETFEKLEKFLLVANEYANSLKEEIEQQK